MMWLRAVSAGVMAGVLLGMPPTAAAQSRDWIEPPTGAPVRSAERTQDLDVLFAALKAAPDAATARAIEQRIWARWSLSRSDTTNLLMSRVRQALEAKDTDLALRLLDAVVQLDPDHVEAWNRRATLRYMRRDFAEALADIRRVLALEPRHFGALTGLGLIMQDFGDEKGALEAFRRALAIHPHLQRVPDFIKALTPAVEGRDI